MVGEIAIRPASIVADFELVVCVAAPRIVDVSHPDQGTEVVIGRGAVELAAFEVDRFFAAVASRIATAPVVLSTPVRNGTGRDTAPAWTIQAVWNRVVVGATEPDTYLQIVARIDRIDSNMWLHVTQNDIVDGVRKPINVARPGDCRRLSSLWIVVRILIAAQVVRRSDHIVGFEGVANVGATACAIVAAVRTRAFVAVAAREAIVQRPRRSTGASVAFVADIVRLCRVVGVACIPDEAVARLEAVDATV